LYDDSLENPDPTDSITVYVINGLTVIPREADVCVGCDKDFQAWTCDVGGTAQNVTASSTFSTSNGSFNGHTLTAGSTPSSGEGEDWVKATYGGETTDDDHDCDLTVVTLVLSGPDNVVIAQAFSISVSTGASWNGSYWDASHNIQTTPAYRHEFGVKVPETVAITNGSGSFSATQFTMEAFGIKVTLRDVAGGCYDVYEVDKENVWARVKGTYIGDISLGPEEGHENDPGYFDNNKPRAALPYGATNQLNSILLVKKSLADAGVDTKVRDRGPFFPYREYYPKNNDWYNEYWDDGGWKPLAEFMQGLRRVGSGLIINGSGIDLTKNAIESLGFSWNEFWSGTVYWRFK
jgi:hypothetical protein